MLSLATHQSTATISTKCQTPFHNVKQKRFQKVVWIRSHNLQWKFKLCVGKLAWGVNAKHCWALSTNFWNNLNFHWFWWDQIQAIFLNLSYFLSWMCSLFLKIILFCILPLGTSQPILPFSALTTQQYCRIWVFLHKKPLQCCRIVSLHLIEKNLLMYV